MDSKIDEFQPKTLYWRWLPVALFVTIGLQALPALVLVHLETTLLFEITHGGKLAELK